MSARRSWRDDAVVALLAELATNQRTVVELTNQEYFAGVLGDVAGQRARAERIGESA